MTRSRVLIIVQCVAAVVVVAFVPNAGGLLGAIRANWQLLLALMFAQAILTGFGVWLPRGDTVDNSAALAFTAGVYIAPQVAALALALAWVAGVVASRRRIDAWRLLEQVSRRALLVGASFYAMSAALVRYAPGSTLSQALGPGFAGSPVPIQFAVGVLGVAFVVIDLLLEELHSSSRSSSPISRLVSGVIQLRGWMVVAEMSVAVLAVLIYPAMQLPGIVIAAGMLLVMRRSFALVQDMRVSYDATIQVLANSLEEADPSRRGHSDRVSNAAAESARRLGFQTKRVEDIRNAARFHDVARLGADDVDGVSERSSSELLADVGLLSGALPILQLLDGAEPAGSPDESVLVGAYLIARFSSADSEQNMGMNAESDREDALGSRLYASTRRNVDRVISQVELADASSPGLNADVATVAE